MLFSTLFYSETGNKLPQKKQIRKAVYNQIMSIAPQSKAAEYADKKSSFISNKTQQSSIKRTEISENVFFFGTLHPVGNGLALDDQKLSNEMVQTVLTPEDYNRYLYARKDLNTMTTFGVVGIIAEVVCGGSVLYWGVTNEPTKILTITSGVVFVGSIPIIIYYGNRGRKVLDEIAIKYNRNNNYSYNISPSMMSWEMPQAENNYGLGLTLSMNF